MRLVFLLALLVVTLSGCSRDAGDDMTNHNGKDRAQVKVKSIIIRGGCFGCHNVDEHRFGPSWKAVSERYKNNPDATALLSESVKHGSGGKWTDAIGSNVMTPNGKKVNDAEIAEVVAYILTL